ncbi:MAG: glycogen-binding domain-containing protein [Sedimentisphaerales bacterium]|nr:glycogen-binding domain-containing protein [Sedimentisphaerales bacterium]
MIRKGRKQGTIQFLLQPNTGVSKVGLAGSFNKWQPETMRKQKDGAYAVTKPLSKGTYEYKFLIDGQWQQDPDNPSTAWNQMGSVNSVLVVD